ncbi:bifunctional adenosylcobinamide kinase/adenosylcobinamide-phosphate guanylyltransferase [Microvirga terrae]|uniref:Bifunctional adenosylcobalamin biosynthesis protein n=1 Tax=Microvirga terrae TaxID=2740529 RepID=A0ABY5RPS7_9HYPH|nr:MULTISPECIES: bifunctional adenosylcobinamide kinase/adenosylcobinamide-phosphate guanylyltransferase [Microvirga]MBQ0822084.1 bifunctional adenosylcobinamide kinase/adenosylcobinamide-phosphate guanylyltransferase [Microvirga sp. HBU67558]UVF19018.1 bifunctional adenosylcobinamide kinase/adenosylcobinamide-phosphate guanylyltransferase [Microvirga terrae]
MTIHRRVLILGGARSGKSRTALQLAESTSPERDYIATAQAFDDEMRERIDRHRAERDRSWQTIDAPLDLVEAVQARAAPRHAVLVDCLTLWLSNIMLAGRDPSREADRLVQTVRDARGPLILVSNEVGHGIVPSTPLGRSFRDEQGRLNQRVAEVCDAVIFVAAGQPILLKPAPPLRLHLE